MKKKIETLLLLLCVNFYSSYNMFMRGIINISLKDFKVFDCCLSIAFLRQSNTIDERTNRFQAIIAEMIVIKY